MTEELAHLMVIRKQRETEGGAGEEPGSQRPLPGHTPVT
jgi:hypothetical protein